MKKKLISFLLWLCATVIILYSSHHSAKAQDEAEIETIGTPANSEEIPSEMAQDAATETGAEATPAEESTEISDAKSESPIDPATPINSNKNEKGRFDLFEQQEKKIDKELEAKKLDLRSVLSTGLNKNINQQVREFQKEKNELKWEDNFAKFWYPHVKLNLATEDQRLQSFRKSSTINSPTPNSPTGTFGLEFGEYSVFNWGRDYLEYQNNKNTYNRTNQALSEKRRQLKFNLISQYFALVKAKKILNYRKQQLQHTSFIHRMARQKLGVGKLSSQEYYQTRTEYLRAYSLFQEAQFETIEQDQSMADLLGDQLQSTYKPIEELKFVGINTSMQESLNLAVTQSPLARDAQFELDNANRSYKKALKENMALPEIKLKLGAYETEFSKNGSSTQFTSGENNRDVELVASLNLTWTLWGDGGFFNSRVIQSNYLDKRIAEVKFINAKRELEVRVQTLYRKLKYLERRAEGSELQMKNAQSSFDSILDSYVNGRTLFANLKIGLDQLMEAQINYEESKLQHLIKKMELADTMGLEDFPGTNFENLAERIQ
jgi:outer membrane protein TolC